MAELVLSLCDLLEAEGRLLRQNITRTGAGCGIAGIGLLFVCGALLFLTAAVYEILAMYMPKPLVLLVMCAICGLIAVILIIWSGKKCLPKRSQK